MPLVLLVSIFLALDFSLLFINLNLTQKLSHDSLLINISGRQRMLSQRIAKELFIINHTPTLDNNKNIENLSFDMHIFDQTIHALLDGGQVIAPDYSNVLLKPLKDKVGRQLLTYADALWHPINDAVKNALSTPELSVDKSLVLEFALVESNSLMDIMNELTIRLEDLSKENASTLRIAQLFVFFLVLINFFLIYIRFNKEYAYSHQSQLQFESLAQKVHEAVLLFDARKNLVFKNHSAIKMLQKHAAFFERYPPVRWLKETKEGEIDRVQIDNHYYVIQRKKISFIPNEIDMVSLIDITENESLKARSNKDPLTHLLNRCGLEEGYNTLSRTHAALTCLFIDLDKFKEINDTYGHDMGDEVLRIIAKRLKSSVKESDIVSRLGGDEFIILLSTAFPVQSNVECFGRIINIVKQPIHASNELIINIEASIGISHSQAPHCSLKQLINQADREMYENKQARHPIID